MRYLPYRNYLVPLIFLIAFLIGLLLVIRGLGPGVTSLHAATDLVTDTQLLSAASALNAKGFVPKRVQTRCQFSAVYIQWGAATSAGAIQIESSYTDTYAGTWAPIGAPVAWSAANKTDIVQIQGMHSVLQARISTAIVGDTVNVWALCN